MGIERQRITNAVMVVNSPNTYHYIPWLTVGGRTLLYLKSHYRYANDDLVRATLKLIYTGTGQDTLLLDISGSFIDPQGNELQRQTRSFRIETIHEFHLIRGRMLLYPVIFSI